MDQIKIGKFIASCRKEQGMTQAALAEKLGISDRAVSKWETGRSMPDSGIMLELCGLLKINVNELLSGERIMAEAYGKIAEQNLIELKRKDENNFKWNVILTIVFSIVMAVGIAVCLICDLAISGKPTWSLITLGAILIGWVVTAPMIWYGKKGVRIAMIALSILIIPFLYVLSLLTGVKAVFRVGAVMSLLALAVVWILYVLFGRLKDRKLLAAGVAFAIAVPFTFVFNFVLSKLIGSSLFDIWDALTLLILLAAAVTCIAFDRSLRKRKAE